MLPKYLLYGMTLRSIFSKIAIQHHLRRYELFAIQLHITVNASDSGSDGIEIHIYFFGKRIFL